MAMSDNALIQYEAGQTFHNTELMTTADGKKFAASFKPFSVYEGKEVMVMPSGVVNGGDLSATANVNEVAYAAMKVRLAASSLADDQGEFDVSAGTLTLARPTTGTHLIYSVVVHADGQVEALAGTEGGSFDEGRGAAGSAPFIPVDAVEVGQVRLSSQTDAAVLPSEIFQIAGTHKEMADYPIYSVEEITGSISFADVLPAIHVGDTYKQVAVKGYTPLFADVPKGYDFTPAEISHSVNSQQVYGSTVGSTSKSIGQAGFSAILKDGLTDDILSAVDHKVWIKFKQNRNRLPYSLTLGVLGMARSYPADNNVTATFTVSAESSTVSFAQ